MTEQILDHLAEKIEIADAILIGAGSGLSSAAGYDHYHWSPALLKALAQFQEYYRFPSPFAGFYHCFSSYGAQWAYYSQYIRFMWEAPIGQPYLDLKKAVGSKPAFILTTNVDMQVSRLFSKEQVCTFQGDFGFCQCSQPCHDQIWTNYGLVQRLTQALDGVNLPEEMVPRCPDCGRVLIPWVRDDTFLEGSVWQEGVARYCVPAALADRAVREETPAAGAGRGRDDAEHHQAALLAVGCPKRGCFLRLPESKGFPCAGAPQREKPLFAGRPGRDTVPAAAKSI